MLHEAQWDTLHTRTSPRSTTLLPLQRIDGRWCQAAGTWPFQRLANDLCTELLEPTWGRRHGAAIGLREILRSHAGAAGVAAPAATVPSGGWQ